MTRTSWLAVLAAVAASGPAAAQSPLSGRWTCTGDANETILEFRSRNELVYDGQAMAYQVLGGSLIVMTGDGPAVYQYRVDGDQATFASDALTLRCRRGAARSAPASGATAGASGGKFNHLLQGTLCYWSGSSSGGASYASTTRVSFDGRGRFTTGSESSASNQAGQAYSGGGGEGGTYEVLGGSVGATIRIKWGDGSVGTATVHFVVDGQITEIKYGERLYGKALC